MTEIVLFPETPEESALENAASKKELAEHEAAVELIKKTFTCKLPRRDFYGKIAIYV